MEAWRQTKPSEMPASRIAAQATLAFTILFVFAAKQPEDGAAKKAPSPVRAEFPLSDQFPVVLPLKFKGNDYRFVFDTGCSVTSFSDKHRSQLGQCLRTQNSSGPLWQSTPMNFYAVPEETPMELGPFRLKGEVGAMDYSALADWLAEYDGLLGYEVMAQFIVQFDFQNKRLRFLTAGAPPAPDWGTPLDIQVIDGTPHLEIQLTKSISEQFMIDTGAPLIHLQQPKFERLINESGGAAHYKKRPITRDTKDLAGVMMNNFRVKDLTYTQFQIVEYGRSFLGMEFLRKHALVTLDCGNRKLYLKQPDPKPAQQ